MVQGGLARAAIACLCALALLLPAASARAAIYFGATISGETYGQTGNAPNNTGAWDLFERHAGRRVAVLNQGHDWARFDKSELDATHARGAIPLVTMNLSGTSLEAIADGDQDAAIEKWAREAKAWGHPFFFAPWWEMNGAWYPWGRSPDFVAAWRHFHDVVAGQGASNVTWTWVANSIWFDPESDPSPYYPGDAYVDWLGLDTYNWGRNPAQPDKWIDPEQTIGPTLKILRELAPSKPVAIVETASSEYGGNKTDWIRELLTTYLPHHPEIGAFLWFNWNFKKGEKRADWPIESSTPAQQEFRAAIQSSLFAGAPVSLPDLTKVPPPPAAIADPARPEDLSTSAEMASGPDLGISPDGVATAVWSAKTGGEFRVFSRRIAADGSRGPVRQLSANGGDALAPRVGVAPDGTATVAWARSDGADFRVQTRQIAADGTPAEATRTLSGSGQDAADPQVAVGADGTATVAWKRFDGFHYLVQARHVAADGTSEEAAQRLSESGQDAVEPEVGVGPDGIATVVWSRFDGEASVVQERRLAPDGTLGEIANLSASGRSAIEPRLGIGPAGEATVIWDRFDGANWIVQARRLSPAGVSEGGAIDLSAAGRDAAEPDLAVDAAGVATAVWERYDGTQFVVQARRLSAAGLALGAAVNLSAGGRDAAGPRVAATPDGGATVVWSRFDGANWIVQRRDLSAAGSPGVASENLSAAGRGAGEGVPAWSGDGTLAIVWKRATGAGETVQARIAPKPGIPLPPPAPEPPAPEPESTPPTSEPQDESTSGQGPNGKAGSGAPGKPATVAPAANSFSLGKLRRNRRRGTASLAVWVPGPGLVAVDGAAPRQRRADAAGRVLLPIKPRPKARRALLRRGRVRLHLTVTFVPTGGRPSSRYLSPRLRMVRRG